MLPSNFTSKLDKQIIRRNWNAPLLNFLKNHFGKKLIYFGLPSPNAEDISDWIDLIDMVFAFQCRDYPNPSDPSQSDIAVRKLESKLLVYTRQKKILDFRVYDGYIEEVVINGKDNDNLKFELKDFITLYNLDFCNEITIPQEIFNEETGCDEEVYKLHVIRNIIDLQRRNNSHPNRFVIFLTVKANFWMTEASDYENLMKNTPIISDYLKAISSIRGINRSVRILKCYAFDALSSILCANNYIPEFLPVVMYKSGIHDLVQFTVVCTYEKTVGRSAIIRQNINEFLNESFLAPDRVNNRMIPIILKGFKENNSDINPVNILNKTIVYNELWNK